MKPIVLTIMGCAAFVLLISRNHPHKKLPATGSGKQAHTLHWKERVQGCSTCCTCSPVWKQQRPDYEKATLLKFNTF